MVDVAGPGDGGGSPPGTSTELAAVSLTVGRSVIGWGVVFVVLIAMADIPAMAELAAAFAWLIFVSVMMLYGPSALASLSGLLGGTDS